MDDRQITASAIAQVPLVFLAIVPSMNELVKIDNQASADIARYSRDIAAVVAIGIGAALAALAHSPLPFVVSLAMTAVMYVIVEKMVTVQIGEK